MCVASILNETEQNRIFIEELVHEDIVCIS